MKRPTNVHKFKFAMALLGVLLVGVIGYTLWFVSHSEKVANDAYAKSNNSYTVKPTKKVASTQPAQTQKYLTIKEWGVQIPLTPDESDLTYVAKTEEGTTFYHILSPSIAKLCGPGSDGSLGILGRNVSDPAKQGSYQPQVKVGAYFYTMGVIQNPCSQDDAIDKKEIGASITLNKQFKLLQTVPQKYLTIKEWGMQFQIPSVLTSMKYTVKDANTVELDSGDLADLAGSTKYCGASPGYLGNITRMTTAPAEMLDVVKIAHIGSYYYYHGGPQQACIPESAASESPIPAGRYKSMTLQSSADNELLKLLPTTFGPSK